MTRDVGVEIEERRRRRCLSIVEEWRRSARRRGPRSTRQIRGGEVLDLRYIEGIERWVLYTALSLTALAAVVWQTPHGIASTAAGGLIAFLDLIILRHTTTGIFRGSQRKRAALSVALVLKMGLLLAAIWGAVSVVGFDPVGVGLGVSALVIGIVGGTLFMPTIAHDRAQPER